MLSLVYQSRCGMLVSGYAFAGESVAERLQRGSTGGTGPSTGPTPPPTSLAAPPPHVATGLPELSEDDIMAFLEQARELTRAAEKVQSPEVTGKSPTNIAKAHGATHVAPAQPRFVEMSASSRANVYAHASAATAQHLHAHARAGSQSKLRDDGGGEGGGEGGGGDKPNPPWKYTDIKSPPDWLQYTHTKGGLPSTKPPAVPRMIPPPPPQAFPQFSYARPPGGPYSPPPVPTYSISSPPPVAAATWLPLAAYIQPPKDQPNPEA